MKMWNGKRMFSSVYGNGKNATRRYHGWTRFLSPPSSRLLTSASKNDALPSFSNGRFWSSRWVSSPPSLRRSYCTADSEADDALRQLSQTVEKWVEDFKVDGASALAVQPPPPPPPTSASLQWEFEEWNAAQAELWQAGLQKMMTMTTPVVEEVEILSGIERLAPLKIRVEFSKANELSEITADDANKFFTFRKEDQSRHFPEGLPKCLAKEFETSRGNSLLIRSQLVKLCDHLRTLATPSIAEGCESKPVELNGENAEAGLQPTEVPTSPEIEEFGESLSKEGDLYFNQRSFPHESSSDVHEDSASHPDNTVATQQEVSETLEHLKANTKSVSLPYSKLKKPQFLSTVDLGPGKQIVIDGLRGSGKSTLLAMLVLWARSLGWLVFYVPSAKDWTRNHFYYKNEITGVWDTPLQAVSILESFLKASGTLIEKIPCRVFDPIILGEGPGIGPLQGVQELPVQEGFTLHDLVHMGIQTPHAAVSVVVRLKRELSLVTEVPVLIAIDEFNSWFTFSEFREAVTAFSVRNIHANELAMVQAFRNIVNGPITVVTFSHSTAVGKLPKQHPGIPSHIKVYLDRYSFHEAVLMLKYYQRQLNKKVKTGRRIRKMLYVMTNGNAMELRDISIVRSGLVGRGEAMTS